MKFECSYTDINGLTVSLAVSATFSFFEPSFENSGATSATPDLVSSAFAQAIPELSTQLLPVHDSACLALQTSFCRVLHKSIDGDGSSITEV